MWVPVKGWKEFAAKFEMPAVERSPIRVICTNCEKTCHVSRIYNFDELEPLGGFLCNECSSEAA